MRLLLCDTAVNVGLVSAPLRVIGNLHAETIVVMNTINITDPHPAGGGATATKELEELKAKHGPGKCALMGKVYERPFPPIDLSDD